MHSIPLLHDIVVILGAAVVVALVFHRLRLPALVGYVVAGAFLGPDGFGLVRSAEQVDRLSEVGVVLLLFTIGIEFSLEKLLAARRSVLVGGPVQLLSTLALGFGAALALGRPRGEAVYWGMLLALSSTAIPIRLLQKRAETDSAHGRGALGIAIFQDLAVVPMMMLLPFLAGVGAAPVKGGLPGRIAIGIATVAGIVLLTRWLVPRLLYQVARTRDREVFLLSVLGIGLAVAWAGSSLGLSLALGAFLAGLILSESEYGHQALASLLPFRDVFLSIFFVSVGMSLDLEVLLRHPILVVGGAAAVLLVKTLLATLASLAARLPLRSAVMAGMTVGQIGEFSLVLAAQGETLNLASGDAAGLFLAVAVATMAVTPLLVAAAPRTADAVVRRFGRRRPEIDSGEREPPCPLVIVGYGLNGRNLALAATRAGIRFTVVETNPDSVREAKELGCRAVYGDATQEAVLHEAGIAAAQVAVVAVSDPAASRTIVAEARALSPGIHLIVRTRYAAETGTLLRQGADEVVPEEFETSVEIFSRVLRRFLVDEGQIAALRSELRAGAYGVFRRPEESMAEGGVRLPVPDTEMRTFEIEEGSEIDGVTLAKADLRRRFGITVLAVRRGEEVEPNPDPATPLRHGEALVAFGTPDQLAALARAARVSAS